ncbi:MAG: FG-GAP repeat protein [Steroidobacteraceae bacterium]
MINEPLVAPGLPPAPSGHPAAASFSAWGQCLGCSGLELYDNRGRTEIFASTTHVQIPTDTFPGPSNDHWYALVYDPARHSFDEVFASERQPGGIAKLLLLPGATRDADELAVCGLDGSIRFYAAQTKRLKPARTRQFPIQDVTFCAIGDFDHRGHTQYLLGSSVQAAVFDERGRQLWSLPAPMFSYNDMIVGQMDDDPALEIAVAQYVMPGTADGPGSVTIYDGATHESQLRVDPADQPEAAKLVLARGSAPHSRLLVVSEGWGRVDGIDTVSGARQWQVATPINIQSLEVAHGIAAGSPEQLLIGDGQWGSVHVVDAATGIAQYDITNPEWGVTQIAVGDVDHDGKPDLLWGADAGSSGPQRFVLADVATRTVKNTSRDIDPYFTAPAVGRLLGDASRQVVFASRTTDNTYDSGSVIALDERTGKVFAIQDVPQFQGWGNDYALKVADVDGDGLDDIVVSATHFYDGAVDVYGATPARRIVQKSTTWQGYGMPGAYPAFTAMGLADADRRGRAYAAVAFREYDPTLQLDQTRLVGLDLTSGAEKWRLTLPSHDDSFGAMITADIQSLGRDASGAELLMVLSTAPRGFAGSSEDEGAIDIVRVAGSRVRVVASYLDLITAAQAIPGKGKLILIGTSDGNATVLKLTGSTLTAISSRMISTSRIDAIRLGEPGELWIVSGYRAMQVRTDGSIGWKSTDNGYYGPTGILFDPAAENGLGLWISSVWRVDGFRPH